MKIYAIIENRQGETSRMSWSTEPDDLGAMLSVAQLLQHAKDDNPWAPKITSIRIDL